MKPLLYLHKKDNEKYVLCIFESCVDKKKLSKIFIFKLLCGALKAFDAPQRSAKIKI